MDCNQYCCELIVKSTQLLSIKKWLFLLSTKKKMVRFPVKIRRFTLLRSPLGNKKSKDQFELREHCVRIRIVTSKVSFILYFLDVIRNPIGVNLKINISRI